jgi:hypothetical protein
MTEKKNREDRLRENLRANLQKRKAQARARLDESPDETIEGQQETHHKKCEQQTPPEDKDECR